MLHGPAVATHVATDHPVLAVMRDRAARGTAPGAHDDGNVVALAVQGGAARGVYSAAMLNALDDVGLANTVDRIYACSSGALNAVYSLGRGGWYALSTYYEDLPGKKYIDFARLLRGDNLIDLDEIFDQLLEVDKPVGWDTVLNSAIDLRIAVTDLDTLSGIMVGDFADQQELKAALKASCWLPIAVKGTTTFRGKEMIDGGVVVKHPARLALADKDVTHVLALSTRTPGVHKSVSRRSKLSAKIMLERLKPGLADAYLRGLREYELDRIWMRHATAHATHAPFLLEMVPSPTAPRIKSYDTDTNKLFAAARSAYTTACEILLGTPVNVVPRFALAPM